MINCKAVLATVIIFIQGIVIAKAQTSFMADKGVAVFYPSGFDSAKTLPSFAITKQLKPQGVVAASWKLVPVFSSQNGKSIATLEYDGSADLYGNGEVVGPLRRNGTNVTLWNTDNYAYGTDSGRRLYQAHPWVMGVRRDGTCFGIIADNTWKQEFHLSNPIQMISDGPSFRVIVIEKSNPEELLKTLGQLTGTIELPPLWALGYHQCRYSYFPDTRVQEIADELRSRKIPADAIWMDIDYMQRYKIFTFDSTGFSDPKALNHYLHQRKLKSVYMIDPGVKKEASYFIYEQGSKQNVWVQNNLGEEFNGKVWPGACAFPDFTRPAVRQWWGTLYKDFMATGIDGIWNDMNEPSVFDGPDGTMPIDNIHLGGDGLPKDIHLRYHNVYGTLMVKASREGIVNANPDKRPFILSRANYLGGQKYAATWTGDNTSTWEHFKMATPMVLNMGLSGQPFTGPDLGGFAKNADANLFANWISVGAFYPFCRNHSAKSSANQEPWAFGEAVENTSRIALNRRYRLLPYLYTLFWEASQTGLPVMRPVFFADIKDTSLRKEEAAFLWGKDLLIVPQWAKTAALPKGIWKSITINEGAEEMDTIQPRILMRGGAVVPMTNRIIQNTTEYNRDSLTLLICLDRKNTASGQIYLDAGEGNGYKKGEFEVVQFVAVRRDKQSLSVKCKHISGQLNNAKRYYRVGLVSDRGTVYSEWIQKTNISMRVTD